MEKTEQNEDGLTLYDKAYTEALKESKLYIDHDSLDKQSEGEYQAVREYSQLVIKYLFLLNGGAMLSIPAFNTFVDLPIDKATMAFCFFVTGLVCVVLCTLAAFFTALYAYRSTYCEKKENFYYHISNKLDNNELTKESASTLREACDSHKKTKEKYHINSSFSEAASIIFGLASLLFFILGASVLIFIDNLDSMAPFITYHGSLPR